MMAPLPPPAADQPDDGPGPRRPGRGLPLSPWEQEVLDRTADDLVREDPRLAERMAALPAASGPGPQIPVAFAAAVVAVIALIGATALVAVGGWALLALVATAAGLSWLSLRAAPPNGSTHR